MSRINDLIDEVQSATCDDEPLRSILAKTPGELTWRETVIISTTINGVVDFMRRRLETGR